jgi:ABC-type glycerol-3-phosphate transport system substrate-binding protein
MRGRSRFLLVLALALAPLALAAPASATPPTVETFHFEGTDPFVSCEGFDIIVNFSVDIVERTFYDNTGEPVRIQVQFQGEGELVNTVTGATNTGSGPTMDIIDLEAGTDTTVGLVFHNNLPGEGIVALQAGRITVDEDGNVLFSAGPQPGFEGIDWCSILD